MMLLMRSFFSRKSKLLLFCCPRMERQINGDYFLFLGVTKKVTARATRMGNPKVSRKVDTWVC